MKTFSLFAAAFATLAVALAGPAAAQSATPAAGAASAPAAPRFVPFTPPVSAKAPDFASDPSESPVETVTISEPTKGEPSVQRTVIDDKNARIEELKVRGQVKRIVVTPKQSAKLQYEILPNDGTLTGDSTASHTPHGNEGRRVWNVLQF
jgi:hypothetical protein